MSTCDDCKHRTGWRAEYSRFGKSQAVADCMHPEWPEWWKARGERPLVTPGSGSACRKYEQRKAGER